MYSGRATCTASLLPHYSGRILRDFRNTLDVEYTTVYNNLAARTLDGHMYELVLSWVLIMHK